jgi:pimeloyl-ACP methyl ester carboxylesterase
MPFMRHADIDFHYDEAGAGTSFVFQHGLGGDVAQPLGLFVPPPGVRVLALDCRGHGATRPLGDPALLGFTTFAADVIALLDHLEVERAIVGGISMGAGVALRLALSYPERVLALALVRPAWLDAPMPENVERYAWIAALIRRHGAAGGLEHFRRTPAYTELERAAPDAAASLVGQFQSPRAEDSVDRLERIPRDVPSDAAAWSSIAVPTLVLANRQDPIHPFGYGETLARAIPGAAFAEMTSKSVDRQQYVRDVRRELAAFLMRLPAVSA